MVSQYGSTCKANKSSVIYCFDCDEFDSLVEDRKFLKEAHSKNSGTKDARDHAERCAGTISHEVGRDALAAFMTD